MQSARSQVELERKAERPAKEITLGGRVYKILSDDMMFCTGLRADGTPFPMVGYRVTLIR